ncbi:MAG TPA: GntR family transcriptional regulator [Actinopolymorphaceae bacterium]|jgi:GntR family transcriptional regulator
MSLRSRLGRDLAAVLEREILSGRWPTGSKLPTERELAVLHGVSRQTVREALDELERACLVVRRQGSGTYVAERRLEQSLLGHFSIVEAIRSSGLVIETTVLAQAVGPALPAVAESLGVAPESPVVELERLRAVGGEPFMLERTWLPAERLPGIEDADLTTVGLYETLRERYGVVLVRAVESFEPIVLHADEARRLGERSGRPALMLLRTTYDDQDRAIESARAILRADRCRSLVERRVVEPPRQPAASRRGRAGRTRRRTVAAAK